MNYFFHTNNVRLAGKNIYQLIILDLNIKLVKYLVTVKVYSIEKNKSQTDAFEHFKFFY